MENFLLSLIVRVVGCFCLYFYGSLSVSAWTKSFTGVNNKKDMLSPVTEPIVRIKNQLYCGVQYAPFALAINHYMNNG